MSSLLFNVSALVALVPGLLAAFRREARPDLLFWASLAVAFAGAASWSAAQLLGGAWQTGLSVALWLTVAVCVALFALVSALTRIGWRLMPLVMPYLALLAALATLLRTPAHPLATDQTPAVWVDLHIATSVATYGVLTLAAIAGLAAFVQERALKGKRPTALTRALPSLVDSESLQFRLLAGSEVVLGLGLLTGTAVLHFAEGTLVRLDHKTVLSVAAFVVIGALLALHARTGVRGRRAARLVLVAYLLLTLAYPGVKFVTDVLLA